MRGRPITPGERILHVRTPAPILSVPVSRQDTRGRLGKIRTYDRRQILQSAVRKTTPGPGTAPPGRLLFAPGSGPRRGTIGNPPRRGRLEPSWRDLGPSGEGRRVGGRDRRGQRRTAGDLDLLPAWVGYPRLTRRTLGRGPPAVDPGPHDHSTADPSVWANRGFLWVAHFSRAIGLGAGCWITWAARRVEVEAADEVLAVVLTSGVTAVAFETKDWLETAGSALLAAGSW